MVLFNSSLFYSFGFHLVLYFGFLFGSFQFCLCLLDSIYFWFSYVPFSFFLSVCFYFILSVCFYLIQIICDSILFGF